MVNWTLENKELALHVSFLIFGSARLILFYFSSEIIMATCTVNEGLLFYQCQSKTQSSGAAVGGTARALLSKLEFRGMRAVEK